MSGLTVMAWAKGKPSREAKLEQAMRAVVAPTIKRPAAFGIPSIVQ
jgi:hypothetical protein